MWHAKEYKMFRIIIQLLACALMLAAAGCDMGGGYLIPIIPETTEVIDESTTDVLESVSDNNSELTFSESTAQLETLVEGDVIVVDITPAAPNGLLRKVAETYESDGKFVVVTTDATLEDAIEQGTLRHRIELKPQDIQSFTALHKGVFLKQPVGPYQEEDKITIGLDQVDLGEGVTVSGYIAFIPQIDFKANIKLFTLVYARLTSTITEEFKLEATARAEGSYSYELNPPLAIMTFPTIIVAVGGVPVTFTPQVYINAGINGEISAQITTGVKQTASLTAGIEYQDGIWTESITPEYTFETTPPTVEAQAQLSVYAGPEVQIKIWTEIAPSIDLRGNVTLAAALCENGVQVNGDITAGAELILGVKFDKLSRLLDDYTATVWNPEPQIVYELPECEAAKTVCCFCYGEESPSSPGYGDDYAKCATPEDANHMYGCCGPFRHGEVIYYETPEECAANCILPED